MRIKNLVVANVTVPGDIIRTKSTVMEGSFGRSCVICREEKNGYIDLETGCRYAKVKRSGEGIGMERVNQSETVPLTDYYNSLGLKKKNSHEDKDRVYAKVSKLKRDGKI